MRVCAVLLLIASVGAAQDPYARKLLEADQAFKDERPDNPITERLEAEYAKLAEAEQLGPRRWEHLFFRGLNRCKVAFFMRGIAASTIARRRAEGASNELVEHLEKTTKAYIAERVRQAHHNFQVMMRRMKQRGEWDADRILFANAAMKFAGREYLSARGGKTGAIEDLKTLVQRKFLPELCANHIALSYMDLGFQAFREDDYTLAHKYWDKALQWAKQPRLRQVIFTNKAGAYETDNEFGLAEKLLRDQIKSEPLPLYLPMHHKNLGLVLGYQNRLKEALVHYGRSRELCRKMTGSYPLMLLHGNAWIRAAVIHGKLLPEDGDVRLAWRLFLEYREMFGDDYNFSLWFGDFVASLGEYELAWRYLERARDLQPHCTVAYHKLVEIAPRTQGSIDEVKARIDAAKAAFDDARKKYIPTEEMPSVKRVCGGLGDIGDVGASSRQAARLDPDPLAEFDPSNPPPWVVRAAEQKKAFTPWEPPEADAPVADATAGDAIVPHGPWVRVVSIAAGVVVLLGAGVFFVRRRASAA